MKQNLLCLLMIIACAGCSGLKTYPNTEGKNLLVHTTASGSLFVSVKVNLHLYSVENDCKKDYLGTLKLKNGDSRVGIAAGHPVYLSFEFAHGNSYMTYDAILIPRQGAQYIADVSYRDRIYNVDIHEAGARGREESKSMLRPGRQCPE